MKGYFAIAPWEHPGANFDPLPHAQTRLEIGGRKRTLWLKMRDGVIYFREPSLVPLYGVTKRFDFEPGDEEQLVASWKREVERGNYGSFFMSHRKWPGTPVAANYCIILRDNGSGWIKEHFDENWLEIAGMPLSLHSVWVAKPTFSHLSEIICKGMGPQFLNRIVDAAHFQTVEPFWSCGDQKTFEEVLAAAFKLFIPAQELKNVSLVWNCRANSAFRAGSVSGPFSGVGKSFPAYALVWELFKVHAAFSGIVWRRASEHPELQAQYKPKVWRSGIGKWGEDWRGNWIGEQPYVQIELPRHSVLSHHEKLEATLVVRDFFRDKVEAQTLQKLLDTALKSG